MPDTPLTTCPVCSEELKPAPSKAGYGKAEGVDRFDVKTELESTACPNCTTPL